MNPSKNWNHRTREYWVDGACTNHDASGRERRAYGSFSGGNSIQRFGTVNLAWLERGGAVEAETSSLVRHTLPRSKPRRRELVAAGGWLPATGAVRLGRDSG